MVNRLVNVVNMAVKKLCECVSGTDRYCFPRKHINVLNANDNCIYSKNEHTFFF